MDSSSTLEHQNRTLFYQEFGKGDKVLIAFHGFGQDHEVFHWWVKALNNSHRLYLFDLYFHGKSDNREEKISLQQWKETFQAFLKKEDIEQFQLVGFSLGGRFALATATLFPKETLELHLIATDGIYKSPWYRIAITFKGIFRHFMNHSNHFEGFLQFASRLGLIKKPLVRFTRNVLFDQVNKTRVYNSWIFLKPLILPRKKWLTLLEQYQIPTWVYLGETDRIIPFDKVSPIFDQVRSAKVVSLPNRHHEMINASLSAFQKESSF